MKYLCDARMFAVPSYTQRVDGRTGRPLVYRVVIPTDPAIPASCACSSNKFNPGMNCKHIQDVRDVINDDGVPELLQKPGFDLVKVMSDAFRNGFDSGFELGRKAERLGV